MRQQGCNLSRVRAEGDEQDPPGEGKVLEEVPEQVARPAAARAPEVARLPELLPKQRRDPAIARQDQGGEPVGHARQDTQRHDDLDAEGREDCKPRQSVRWNRRSRLSHRPVEVEDLVEGAERQKENDQQIAQRQGDREAQGHELLPSRSRR